MKINGVLVVCGLFWILIGATFKWGVLFGYGAALLVVGLCNYKQVKE